MISIATEAERTLLVNRAARGELSPAEIDEVAAGLEASLESGEPNARWYFLLALGEAKAVQYRALVERFVELPDDQEIAGLAFQVLTSYFSLDREYLPLILRFMIGAAWDSRGILRRAAISSAGFLLYRNKHANDLDRQLLPRLLALVEDPAAPDDLRASAYSALRWATWDGTPPVPSGQRDFDPDLDIDKAVLAAARARFAAGGSAG